MDEMIAKLKEIGIPEEECARVRAYYDGDPDGLAMYLLYMRAMLDDRHEYV